MREASKEYLLGHLSDGKLLEALLDLMDAKLEEQLSVIGNIEKDPIAKMYKLLSVDACVSVIKSIKGELTEINEESTK